jgi:hypothetical protein
MIIWNIKKNIKVETNGGEKLVHFYWWETDVEQGECTLKVNHFFPKKW